MAFDITLDQNQSFSVSTENNIAVNDWVLNPPSPIVINYTIGDPAPAPIAIATTIKNYMAEDATGLAFHIRPQLVLFNATSQVMPLVMSGEIETAYNIDNVVGYELTENNLNVTIGIDFQNLSLIPEGTHQYIYYLRVYGRNATGYFIYNIYSVRIELRVTAPETLFVLPDALAFSHLIGSALPAAQSLDISAVSDFALFVGENYNLSGGNLILATINNGIKVYTGSGNQTLGISLNSTVNNRLAGVYSDVLSFSDSNTQGSVPISLYLFDENIISVAPEFLEFFAIKNITEPDPQELSIQAVGNIVVSAPLWIYLINSQGDNPLTTTVVPVMTSSLTVGVYVGEIIIEANGITKVVPVRHTVVDNVWLGLNEEGINYTDDFSGITKLYTTSEFKIDFTLVVNHYPYGLPSFSTKTLSYKLAVFNNKTEMFVGRTLNNIMAELEDLSLINLNTLGFVTAADAVGFFRPYYRPAEVNLQVDFIHENDDTLNKSYSYENLLFIKGRKPLQHFQNTAILNYYTEPLRVTPLSMAMFNFYQTENHILRVYKNGVLHQSINHNVGQESIFGFKYKFSDFIPGDVVDIRLYQNNAAFTTDIDFGEFISQTYIVMPEGKRSYHIGWENAHGVLEVMEFTGDISFKMAYENNIVNNYKDFKEYLRKIDSRRSQAVVMNTGFILNENPKRLDSLLTAKRAWIMSETEDAVALIPSSKDLANYDSEQELYAYDVEFKINLNNDNQVNS